MAVSLLFQPLFVQIDRVTRLGCPPQPHPFFDDRPPRYHAGSVIMLDPPGQPDWPKETREQWLRRVMGYFPRPGTVLRPLLLALINLFRPGKPLYPTQLWLAARAMCCDKSIRRWLARLVESGFIVKIRRRTEDGEQTSNAYLLCFPDDPPPGYVEAPPLVSDDEVDDSPLRPDDIVITADFAPAPSSAENCPSSLDQVSSLQDNDLAALPESETAASPPVSNSTDSSDFFVRSAALLDAAEARHSARRNARRRLRYLPRRRGPSG